MKGVSSVFMGWSVSVFSHREINWRPLQSWTLMKTLSGQSCLRASSDPWEPGLLHRMVLCLDTDLSSTMTTSSWMRKEYPWLLPSLPLWLQINHQVWAWLPQEGEAIALLCSTHDSLLLSSPQDVDLQGHTRLKEGRHSLELAVPSFFFLLKR